MHHFDVIIIGAGAAGLFCAGVAGQKGLKVLLIDHYEKVAEKIRISGGGRCNFTNTGTTPAQFLSQNPRFCRSALSRYGPSDFIELLKEHHVGFHEKHKGQLFCDRSAEDLINVLLNECTKAAIERWQPCAVHEVRYHESATETGGNPCYELSTDRGNVSGKALVVATGGLSIPKIGATDFGYRIAKQFNLPVVETKPALVPLLFDESTWSPYSQLSGLSLPVDISLGEKKSAIRFREDLLFTHRGLSGPAVLQISSYWNAGSAVKINLLPGMDLAVALAQAKLRSRKLVSTELAIHLPSRLSDTWVGRGDARGHNWLKPVAEISDKSIYALADSIHHWEVMPNGTEGYRKAEVTAGGVDTRILSSQTMESRQRGLYFIGEVVDVTGWLGGFNFQWAWSSAFACAQGLAASLLPGKSSS